MLWAAWLVSHIPFFWFSTVCPAHWVLKAILQEDLFQKGQYGFVITAILDFFWISFNMIDPSDRIIETNNKANKGVGMLSSVNKRFMTKGCLLQAKTKWWQGIRVQKYLCFTWF